MADQQSNDDDFIPGIMVLKGGKWTPHSKLDGGAFGSALISAEELDKSPDFDVVKVVKVPKKGSGEQKEMWVSPRLKARSDVEAAKKLRAGERQTKEKLAAQRRAMAKKGLLYT